MDTNLSKLWETVGDRVAWRAAVQGVMKSHTWLVNEQQQQPQKPTLNLDFSYLVLAVYHFG